MTDGAAPGMPPTLRVADVSKTYPGVRALQQVDLEVMTGEIHAVIGENGAGKSTLMKIIFGVTQPDAGTIELQGRPVTIGSPVEAQRLGISMVHQELTLVPALDVGRNIYLGREPNLAPGVIDWPRLYADAEALLRRLHLPLNPRREVRRLSTAQKQMVEIARALSWKSRILILDEPTSSLTQAEIRDLFRILHDLKANGVSLLYISHRLEELPEVADRITVMRDGHTVGTVDAKTTPIPSLIRMMVGRSVDQQFPRIHVPIGEEALRVEGLTREGVVEDVSFTVHAGEIVGMAGLVGAGRSETARLIVGIDAKDAGRVFVNGQLVDIGSPAAAIAAGGPQAARAGPPAFGQDQPLPGDVAGVLASRHHRTAKARCHGPAVRAGLAYSDSRARVPGAQPLRWQPAEGGPGEMPRFPATRLDFRRANPWHRCGCESRGLPGDERAGHPGRWHPTDLLRAA